MRGLLREQFKIRFPLWDRSRELDCIGIESRKIVHVGECKPGGFNRPIQGFGQLLGVKFLIESDFKSFKDSLPQLGLDKSEAEQIEIANVRYELFLSAKSGRRELLNAMRDKIGGPLMEIELIFLENA